MTDGILSMDWLTLYVNCENYENKCGAKIERQKFSTRHYKYIDNIYFENILTFVLAFEPHSSALKPHSGLLKISNETLYHNALWRILRDIPTWLNINVISISRLDLCYDFQKFKFGLMPETLIAKFIKGAFFKIGQAKYKLEGEQGASIPHSYLRFGSNSSPLSVYLYNKTLEFQQVKRKLYIEKVWEQCNFDESLPVWRLEVSIKGNSLKFIKLHTGEIAALTVDNISDKTFRNDLYFSIVNKNFEFRENDGQVRKDRMKRIQLFDNQFDEFYITRIVEKADTDRADKVFIKKMELLHKELRNNNEQFWSDLDNVKQTFIEAAGLVDWHRQKRLQWAVNQ